MQPTQTVTRPLIAALTGLLTAAMMAGCASDRLEHSPPAGVNLSGDWRFNPNLSDDADKLGEKDEAPAKSPGSSHRSHGGGRGSGGMPPTGPTPDGDNFTGSTSGTGPASGGYTFTPASSTDDGYSLQRVALTAPGIDQSTPLPPVTTTSSSDSSKTRGALISRFLKAPMTMSITQKDSVVTIHAVLSDGATTAEDFPSGTQNNIPYGKDQTADRTVGWRGPVFVVTLKVKKGGFREDDFAIDDDDGRLIMTTLTKGGRIGKVEIKRVYDRVRNTG
jgi:hypothetical protein